MTALLGELRFAVRGFRRAPGFAVAAVAALALGVGSTTAIFSTGYAALLKCAP